MICSLVPICSASSQLVIHEKQTVQIFRLLIQRSMLNFDFFLKKISFSATFCVWFKKMLLILYSNNWPNFIIWLSLLLAILGNMCIANACFPGRDVIIFEINLILLIKLFYYMTEKSRQKFKYLQKERWKKRGEKKLFSHF